jgi:flagellar basal-body rod protein FlgB
MDELSSALIERALAGLNQRYLVTAQNIANANSPGYQPLRVSFEEELRSAAGQGLSAIRSVEPRTYAEPGIEDDAAMRLDLELAAASQTAMRYRALVDILARQMALHRALLAAGGR